MPGLYLLAIAISIVGVGLLAARWLPGVVSMRLWRPVATVLVVFLGFDAIGAARGWFASDTRWVIALIPPGIPPEEPLLLGFLALFSIVLAETIRRRIGSGAHG